MSMCLKQEEIGDVQMAVADRLLPSLLRELLEANVHFSGYRAELLSSFDLALDNNRLV
jgi:hypothetical protein